MEDERYAKNHHNHVRIDGEISLRASIGFLGEVDFQKTLPALGDHQFQLFLPLFA